ncbi:hypothetical protein BpHYR1_018100 [Brachionus plicatilis]|uniref:Reverse transcriptase zinc-binding domain-containing protein n=1 Tax=Brachionus plicatilis TaxID=10195 RepID=A0A3M7PE61_BRAPC|nr:hypothetical protein BpHYR1_018100 [Brachionus plicatilis]
MNMVNLHARFRTIALQQLIYLRLDKNFNLKTSKYSNYEKRSRIESEYRGIDWTSVYNKLNNKSLNSNIRVLNYKILNDALNLNSKYHNRLGEKCVLCNKSTETRNHLFVECSETRKFYELIKPRLNKKLCCNIFDVVFNLNFDEDDIKIISKNNFEIVK